MFTLQRQEPRYFEFEVEGREGTYRIPAVDSISLDDLDAYYEAAADGSLAIMRWARALFERECPGAIDGLSSAEFNGLVTAWRDGADLGESRASSD